MVPAVVNITSGLLCRTIRRPFGDRSRSRTRSAESRALDAVASSDRIEGTHGGGGVEPAVPWGDEDSDQPAPPATGPDRICRRLRFWRARGSPRNAPVADRDGAVVGEPIGNRDADPGPCLHRGGLVVDPAGTYLLRRQDRRAPLGRGASRPAWSCDPDRSANPGVHRPKERALPVDRAGWPRRSASNSRILGTQTNPRAR